MKKKIRLFLHVDGLISIRLTDWAGVCGVSSKKSELLSTEVRRQFAGAKLENFLAKKQYRHKEENFC